MSREDSIRHGIYVVEVDDGGETQRLTRYVLIADNAESATLKAAALAWPGTDPITRRAMADEQSGRVRVGRLGDYLPGIEGGRMSRGDAVAIQRIGQR